MKYKPKRGKKTRGDAVAIFSDFRERVSHFSLDFREIRPSEVFEERRKVVLCREAYAWALVLRSFDKLHEVGDLSYLGFTHYLSVL